MSQQEKWNNRFSSDKYAYGETENDFLKDFCHLLPKGQILCLAEGEGRNAVYLAKMGYDVTAIDYSKVGLEKTQNRAKEENVKVRTIHADLTEYDFEKDYWQGIVSIYFHIHKDHRPKIHQQCVSALSRDGIFILESYSTNQLKFESGGPKNDDLLFDLDEVISELAGLDFKIAREVEREILEGDYHTGLGAVVQIIGQKL